MQARYCSSSRSSGESCSIGWQAILTIASSGTARSAPPTPHIQPQNMSDKITATGFKLVDRPKIIGVMKLPSRVAPHDTLSYFLAQSYDLAIPRAREPPREP